MASLKTKFSVGLFLIAGISLAIIGIIWLGMTDYLEKGRYFVAYFDESVQGLDKDSPVKYRGVSIGRVHNIGVAPDENLIEVVMKIESGLRPEGRVDDLVAQLKSVGITGLMFLELERKSPDEKDLTPAIAFPTEYPVIATRPSDISKIFKGLDDVLNLLKEMDLKKISDSIISVLAKVNQHAGDLQLGLLSSSLLTTIQSMDNLVSSEKWLEIPSSVSDTAAEFQELAKNAGKTVIDLNETLQQVGILAKKTTPEMETTADNLNRTLDSVNMLMKQSSDLVTTTEKDIALLQEQLQITLYRIEEAAQLFNRMMETISDQPSQLFWGEPRAEKIKDR